jgi:hypothetical protein
MSENCANDHRRWSVNSWFLLDKQQMAPPSGTFLVVQHDLTPSSLPVVSPSWWPCPKQLVQLAPSFPIFRVHQDLTFNALRKSPRRVAASTASMNKTCTDFSGQARPCSHTALGSHSLLWLEFRALLLEVREESMYQEALGAVGHCWLLQLAFQKLQLSRNPQVKGETVPGLRVRMGLESLLSAYCLPGSGLSKSCAFVSLNPTDDTSAIFSLVYRWDNKNLSKFK